MVKQYGFYYNVDNCTGCKTCAAACREAKDTFAPGFKFRRVLDYQGGGWKILENGSCQQDGMFAYSISFACNHCADPACVAVCPSGAMQKDEETGIVFVDDEICIGCESCKNACPYNAPALNPETGLIAKCDMCRDKVAAGEVPACVGACPMRAIEFGDLAELQAKYGTNADLAPMPDSSITTPSVVFGMPRMTGENGRIVSSEEELL